MDSNKRLTVPEYWDSQYSTREPRQITIHVKSPLGLLENRFHRVLERHLTSEGISSVVEVGAGGSAWLPHMAKNFGVQVTGMDYTLQGCVTARQALDAAGVTGQVIQADVFDPADALLHTFDAAVSFGLVEHFTDTAGAVKAISKLVKPGGLVITEVPVVAGLPGMLMRRMNLELYRLHQPLNRPLLVEAHQTAGLQVIDSVNILGLPGVFDDPTMGETRSVSGTVKRAASSLTRAMTWADRIGVRFPPNDFSSPYAFVVALTPS
jgi:SAM-dependent methyltransferase